MLGVSCITTESLPLNTDIVIDSDIFFREQQINGFAVVRKQIGTTAQIVLRKREKIETIVALFNVEATRCSIIKREM